MPKSEQLNPRIVPSREEDLPEISKLAGIIWRAHYPGIITTEQIDYMLARMYSLETMREEIRLRGIRYDRLIVDDEPGGFASYGPAEEPGVFKLHKLYVLPRWHGHGLGSLLLNYCASEARKAGALRLILSVNKRNTKAIAAYERNGFAIFNSVVVDIGGGFVMDDFVLGKDLVAPALK